MRMEKDRNLFPDRWVLIEVSSSEWDPDQFTCVLAGWYGGYLGSDAWRRSTAIVRRERDEHGVWTFETDSGSRYFCDEQAYGLTGLTTSVLEQMRSRAAITVLELPTP